MSITVGELCGFTKRAGGINPKAVKAVGKAVEKAVSKNVLPRARRVIGKAKVIAPAPKPWQKFQPRKPLKDFPALKPGKTWDDIGDMLKHDRRIPSENWLPSTIDDGIGSGVFEPYLYR